MRPVSVRMFGPLEVDAGGTPLGHCDLGGIKPKQLFEILLLDRGRTVPASWSCPGSTTPHQPGGHDLDD